MQIERELIWICELLRAEKVDFWIDSGTLLGLIREGQLLENDYDIDISVWEDCDEAWEKLLRQYRTRGYLVKKRSYRGRLFAYKLVARGSKPELTIDIKIFRRHGEFAWCPQWYYRPNPFTAGSLAYFLVGLPRYIISHYSQLKSHLILSTWPWPLLYSAYTWWVPKHFYEQKILLYDLIPLPRNYRDYLCYRYGEWQVRRSRWSYIDDDGALKQQDPESLFDTHPLKIGQTD